MLVPVAVWQPCELPYTCYLLTYLLTYLQLLVRWHVREGENVPHSKKQIVRAAATLAAMVSRQWARFDVA